MTARKLNFVLHKFLQACHSYLFLGIFGVIFHYPCCREVKLNFSQKIGKERFRI